MSMSIALTNNPKENYELIKKTNPRYEQVLTSLFEFDPNMFSNEIIDLFKMIGTMKEFTFSNLGLLYKLTNLRIISNYLSFNENSEDRKSIIQPMNIFILCLVQTFAMATSAQHITNSLIQLLGIKIIPDSTSYGSINAVTARVKFPVMTQFQNITITSDVEGLFNASIAENNRQIMETETKTFTFTPGTEKAVYSAPLIQTVIKAMIHLQMFMTRHSAENQIELKPFINLDNTVTTNKN